MPHSEPHLFVHVPKTAGTALRLAMVASFGERVLADYGPDSGETSPDVKRLVHARPDRAALRRLLAERRIVAIVGHVGYAAYSDLFPPERVLTFLREPVARVVSEWRHAQEHAGLESTLEHFAGQQLHRDRQTKMLDGAPIERLAFVGLSERYATCLAALNARLGWSLPHLTANVGAGRAVPSGDYVLDEAVRERVAAESPKDVALYARVRRIWDEAEARVARVRGAAARG